MANVKISFNDPGGLLAGVPLLAPTINAAVAYLDQFLVFKGTLDITVNVETTATGRFAGNGDTVYAGKKGNFDVYESSMVAESRTGVDPHPTTADLSIYIDPTSSYLAQMWWDPNIATRLDGDVPNNLTDGFTVVLHELLHGMGIVGWRDIQSGSLPGNYESVWDSLVAVSGGRATFNGPATLALLGEPVEVRLGGSQGAFHLGNGPTLAASEMAWVEASNFNSYYYYLGERYLLGRLELALLQDLGWTLESTTLTDVVNRWDDRIATRYMVGFDGNDQISGDVLDDRLEGRGGVDLLVGLDGDDMLDGGSGDDTLLGGEGRDLLTGGSGNDQVDGGAGDDTVVYSGNRSAYTVTFTANGYSVSGPDGTDALTAVESARFADQTTALSALPANRAPGGAVALAGTVRQGVDLHVASTLSDADGIGTLSFRWQSSSDGKAWSDIAGAFTDTLRPGEDQVGQLLRVLASWVDGRGAAESVASNTSAAVLGSRVGSAGADVLIGSRYADVIEGLQGNDNLVGGGAADQIDGGADIDRAGYALARSAYTVTVTGSGLQVAAGSGDEGRDTLTAVERLSFTDQGLAFDLDGHAGSAARLIATVFGPALVHNRDAVRIGLDLFDSGQSDLMIAQLALDVRLGAAASHADVVGLLYVNLTNTAPSADVLSAFTGLLDSQAFTPASLTLLAAGLDLTAVNIDLVGLAANGLEFSLG